MALDQPAEQPVVVGRIAGAYGVLGWVRVVSFTEPSENILSYRPWLLGRGEHWREVRPAASRAHGDGYVVQLRDLSSREQAQALAGTLIAVPRVALPELEPADGYYWRDLVGLEVRDGTGQRVGRVDHLVETGAHDVLVIDVGSTDAPGKRPLLVPFLGHFVPEVDIDRGYLVIDWQEPA